jgi:hypothetical protein
MPSRRALQFTKYKPRLFKMLTVLFTRYHGKKIKFSVGLYTSNGFKVRHSQK